MESKWNDYRRIGAVAAFTSAITTFLLWYLPTRYDYAGTFEGNLSLAENSFYMARLWVNFAHVFIALVAYGAAAWVLRRRSPSLAATGFIAFAFWALTEAIGVSVNLWGVNHTWRAGYAAANEPTQLAFRTAITTFQGIWDGLFFVILVTFLIGTLAYGFALLKTTGLGRWLGALFLLAGPLTLIILLDIYFGASLSRWIEWSYPTLQPVSRALLGVWLWRRTNKAHEPKPANQTSADAARNHSLS